MKMEEDSDMLRIDHLTKTYGEKKAVDDLSLHIAPGEIYGFIGHNGAGKTTTLKSIAGILQFDVGDIRIGGTSIREDPARLLQSSWNPLMICCLLQGLSL